MKCVDRKTKVGYLKKSDKANNAILMSRGFSFFFSLVCFDFLFGYECAIMTALKMASPAEYLLHAWHQLNH